MKKKHASREFNLSKIVSNLANKRTIFAYTRTSLALLATGIAFQKVFDNPSILFIGNVLIVSSAIIVLIGVISFIKVKRSIKKQKKAASAPFLD